MTIFSGNIYGREVQFSEQRQFNASQNECCLASSLGETTMVSRLFLITQRPAVSQFPDTHRHNVNKSHVSCRSVSRGKSVRDLLFMLKSNFAIQVKHTLQPYVREQLYLHPHLHVFYLTRAYCAESKSQPSSSSGVRRPCKKIAARSKQFQAHVLVCYHLTQ